MGARLGAVFLIAVLDSSLLGCGGFLFSSEAMRGTIWPPFQIFSAQTEPDSFNPVREGTAADEDLLPIGPVDRVTLTAPKPWTHRTRERVTLHQRPDGSVFLGGALAGPFAANYSVGQPLSGEEPARLRETLLPFLVPSCQSTIFPVQP